MLPLENIVVVELGSSIAGPYASKVLADLGAEVIKVENPDGGDATRSWGPSLKDGGSASYYAANLGKQSITIDMMNPEDISRLKCLISDRADIVIQNLRPTLADRFSLGAEELMREKPELIYCNIWAYGNKGPFKDLPGYDPLMQAFSGITNLTGEPDRQPSRVGVSLLDLGTGMWTAIGALAALQQRTITGRGAIIDTSLLETGIGLMTLPIAQYYASGKAPTRSGLRGPFIVPNDGYQTSDGILVIAVGTDLQFRRFCVALGREELSQDERFKTNEKRYENERELRQFIADAMSTNTRSVWSAKLTEAGIPNAPLQTTEELLTHPQVVACDILQAYEDVDARFVGLPLSIDGVRPVSAPHAPALGEDDQAVFKFMEDQG